MADPKVKVEGEVDAIRDLAGSKDATALEKEKMVEHKKKALGDKFIEIQTASRDTAEQMKRIRSEIQVLLAKEGDKDIADILSGMKPRLEEILAEVDAALLPYDEVEKDLRIERVKRDAVRKAQDAADAIDEEERAREKNEEEKRKRKDAERTKEKEKADRLDNIFLLAETGTLQELKDFLTRYPDRLDEQNDEGKTALMIVIGKGSKDKIKLLLDLKPDLDIRDDIGQSALTHAVIAKNADLVRQLIAKGADRTVIDTRGYDLETIAGIARSGNEILNLLRR
jgi:uncharacterized protein